MHVVFNVRASCADDYHIRLYYCYYDYGYEYRDNLAFEYVHVRMRRRR